MSATPTGRVLRHQPQRTMYTPEINAVKQRPSARYQTFSPSTSSTSFGGAPTGSTPSTGFYSPQPQPNPTSNSPAPAPTITASPGPMAVAVSTPGNNPRGYPSLFYEAPPRPRHTIAMTAKNEELMNRINLSFQSGLKDQQSWAVDALLQVSFNSPDQFLLERNVEMTEHLLSTVTGAPCLDPSYRSMDIDDSDKKKSAATALGSMNRDDDEEEAMQEVLQALLILRNASLTPNNAHYMAQLADCKLIVERGLGLPRLSIYCEFRGYCIEIAEAISFHITPDSPTDSFFVSVVQTLNQSEDRGVVIPSLRALARLVVHDKKGIMESIPSNMVNDVVHYLLVDDEELISAALDFLYQYTASKKNVRTLFSTPMGLNLCTRHLVRLLTYKIVEPPKEYIRLPRRTKKVAPKEPPKLPEELVDELLQMNEPMRATYWIRCSYEEDPDAEVTQISLWKAYESQFNDLIKQGRGRTPILPGVHFINNVTPAFQRSAAMVLNTPEGKKSYIIKGIKPREFHTTPAQLNAPPPPPPVAENREPSTFGVTACLVLENIARSKEGNENLQHTIPQLMRATLLNSTIRTHVQDLLDLLTAHTTTGQLGDDS